MSQEPEGTQKDESTPSVSRPKEVRPFYKVQRGQDSVDANGNLQFADFSPRVVSSTTPDAEIDGALSPSPKDSSAQQSVTSSQLSSPKESELLAEDKNAQPPATKDSGQPKEQSENSKPAS